MVVPALGIQYLIVIGLIIFVFKIDFGYGLLADNDAIGLSLYLFGVLLYCVCFCLQLLK